MGAVTHINKGENAGIFNSLDYRNNSSIEYSNSNLMN